MVSTILRSIRKLHRMNLPQKQLEFLANEELAETGTKRRDFLKFMGFSLGAATLAA